MSARHYTITLSLLAALAHTNLQAQPATLDKLVEQGQYWQSRGDHKRASEIWDKLLMAQPNNPNALYGLALAALDADDQATAQRYLAQLRQSAPNDPLIPQLEQDIHLAQPGPAATLSKARGLTAARQMDEAIAAYDSALQGKKPLGPLALEYYNFLGYTDEGWGRAVQGLKELQRKSPSNAVYQLTLARHLSRQQQTRLEGIDMLRKLSTRKEVASEATDAWRMTLVLPVQSNV